MANPQPLPQPGPPDTGPDSQHRDDLFADLIEAVLPELRAYARGLCGDPHMADDCVQDACMRALSAFPSYDAARPFRPWIFRILRNEWLQRLRRDRRMVTAPDETINGMLVDERLPEDAADGAVLLRLIAGLPADMADAISLVLGLGLSYEEAAAVCNCAPGTMKSRVSRARALLVERLGAPPAQYSGVPRHSA
jgi:RNA polymerase sigma-70 factor (ECF subfamily)